MLINIIYTPIWTSLPGPPQSNVNPTALLIRSREYNQFTQLLVFLVPFNFLVLVLLYPTMLGCSFQFLPLLSRPALAYSIPSCLALFFPWLPHYVLDCPVFLCPILYHCNPVLVIPGRVLSHPAHPVPCPSYPCPILSCPKCSVMSCLTLSSVSSSNMTRGNKVPD